MFATPLISSFPIFSILFIPIIHLNILISVLSSHTLHTQVKQWTKEIVKVTAFLFIRYCYNDCVKVSSHGAVSRRGSLRLMSKLVVPLDHFINYLRLDLIATFQLLFRHFHSFLTFRRYHDNLPLPGFQDVGNDEL